MLKINLKFIATLFVLASLALVSCDNNDNDNPPPVNDEEEITTLTITFSESVTGPGTIPNTVTYTYKDLDGDGGNAPEITSSGNLLANTDYTATITVLNENEAIDPFNKEYNVTLEIQDEDEEHQFFFEYGSLFSSLTYSDTDSNGEPLGLITSWTTGSAGSGILKITLIHEPTKPASTVADAGGETDIVAEFNVSVQ